MKLYRTYLRYLLLFGFFYLIVEGVMYITGVRTFGLRDQDVKPAVFRFLFMFMQLWGAAALFLAWLCWKISEDISKYTLVLLPLAFFGLGVGAILWYASLIPYQISVSSSWVYLGLPFYSQLVRLEAMGVVTAAGYIFWGIYKKYI